MDAIEIQSTLESAKRAGAIRERTTFAMVNRRQRTCVLVTLLSPAYYDLFLESRFHWPSMATVEMRRGGNAPTIDVGGHFEYSSYRVVLPDCHRCGQSFRLEGDVCAQCYVEQPV